MASSEPIILNLILGLFTFLHDFAFVWFGFDLFTVQSSVSLYPSEIT